MNLRKDHYHRPAWVVEHPVFEEARVNICNLNRFMDPRGESGSSHHLLRKQTRTTIIFYNFQQWMSWFSKRWRMQWNVIRNANCKTLRVIKILNAYCASRFFLDAYFSECYYTPITAKCSGFIAFENLSSLELPISNLFWTTNNFIGNLEKITCWKLYAVARSLRFKI